MEYTNFVHWCINQYIMMSNRVKNSIYRKNMQYTPSLLDITLAQKCIFLTAVLNDLPFVRENKQNSFNQIGKVLEASYEKIKGNWKNKSKICVNTMKYYVETNVSYNSFFLQLLIAQDDLYYGGEVNLTRWIEDNMIDLPVDCETVKNVSREDVRAERYLETLSGIIKKEEQIFYMKDEFGVDSLWFDYMKIYNFYEHYWYMCEFGGNGSCIC